MSESSRLRRVPFILQAWLSLWLLLPLLLVSPEAEAEAEAGLLPLLILAPSPSESPPRSPLRSTTPTSASPSPFSLAILPCSFLFNLLPLPPPLPLSTPTSLTPRDRRLRRRLAPCCGNGILSLPSSRLPQTSPSCCCSSLRSSLTPATSYPAITPPSSPSPGWACLLGYWATFPCFLTS